jgi:hypothetical protein
MSRQARPYMIPIGGLAQRNHWSLQLPQHYFFASWHLRLRIPVVKAHLWAYVHSLFLYLSLSLFHTTDQPANRYMGVNRCSQPYAPATLFTFFIRSFKTFDFWRQFQDSRIRIQVKTRVTADRGDSQHSNKPPHVCNGSAKLPWHALGILGICGDPLNTDHVRGPTSYGFRETPSTPHGRTNTHQAPPQ